MKFYRTVTMTTAHVKCIDDNDTVINTTVNVFSDNPKEVDVAAREFCAQNGIDFVKISSVDSTKVKVFFTLEKIIGLADKIEPADDEREGE